MNTCRSLLSDSLTFTTGGTATPEKLIQQQQIAGMLYNFYFTGDAETAALVESNKRITSTGMGMA
jgi:conjugal transfer mating pair stabilization protein TraG